MLNLQVFLLLPTTIVDKNNKTVNLWKESARTVKIDTRTTAQDILTALLSKRIPSSEKKYFSLYISSSNDGERRFIRRIEPSELPMIILYSESFEIEFYIKKKEQAEVVSIYKDIRKVFILFNVYRKY